MPELEHNIQNKIRLWCGEHDILCFRVNVGMGYTVDGRAFTTGVPEGFPDLLALTRHGKIIFVECKTPVGRLRPAQKELHAALRERNFKVIVPRSLEQFIEEIKGEL